MPARQHLQIEQSEKRQRINKLPAIKSGKLTDEQLPTAAEAMRRIRYE